MGRNSLRMTVATLSTTLNSPKATRERGTKSASTRTHPLRIIAVAKMMDSWSPDTAPIKSKMVYASSKESIKRSFNGIGAEIQGTDYAEVSYDSVLEKVSKGRA